MNRIIRSCCLLLLCWGGVQAAVAQTPQQVLQQHYPVYNRTHQCWATQAKSESSQVDHCMWLEQQQTVDTPNGRRTYVLARGNELNDHGEPSGGGHASSGLVAMFVLDQNGRLLAGDPAITVGAFGQAPSGWTLHEFGPGRYGFLNQHADMHQGYGGSHHVILLAQGKGIKSHWIGASYDNSSAIDCDSISKAACFQRTSTLGSRLSIERNQAPTAGHYPLRLTINGHVGNKRYRQQSYLISYDAAKQSYVEPKNSPLSDIDY